jgi:hypothetical protein
VDDIDELLRRLDSAAGPDLERLRDDIAPLIAGMVREGNDALSYWQKVHLEMAIALLPTVWLRLCLTHLKMMREPPAEAPRFLGDFERASHFEKLTANALLARLARLGYPVQ